MLFASSPPSLLLLLLSFPFLLSFQMGEPRRPPSNRRAPDIQDLVDFFAAQELADQPASPHPTRLPLTAANLLLHNRKLFQLRMFGCARCNLLFYQKVEKSKPVSICSTCRLPLEAIPIHEEPAGLGFFRCHAERCPQRGWRWTSFPAARDVKQPCYKCGTHTKPQKVIPSPLLRTEQRPRLTSNVHGCYACEGLEPGQKCPLRGRTGFVASQPHDSSGSTISLGDACKYKQMLNPDRIRRYEGRMHNHQNEQASEDSDDSISTVSTVRSTSSNSSSRGRGRGQGRGRGGGRGGGQ